ncbi:MAG: hypothetical protein K2W79_04640 [Hydrotalea flava]|uniref:hypothetical protein n=1 Tax=Hydrotalea TaxID=1004300 RepID=UPI0009437D8F|nr:MULTISPECIES: hypothetical protein [Hydrotalea]MBY0347527.1 hypothetical protein [Hydrotalea flava]RWZ88345.1 MAG: hypothetical protein EO766_08120 [Hydrotalea sp. AMD]
MAKSLLQLLVLMVIGIACLWVMKQWETGKQCPQCNIPVQQPAGQPTPDHYFREPANKFNIAAYF